MTDRAVNTESEGRAPGFERWWQLILGVICMSMVANLQYGWTLFVNPIEAKHHWKLSSIQFAFSVFVIIETWLVPIEGYLVDKIGPKMVGAGSGILVAAAWVINAHADSLSMLYLGAVIGGIGVGGVYGACVGNALKWFPDRRGFASGITAMGFGAGSALTVFPIAAMIKAEGYEAAFLKFGILQGAVVFVIGWFLKAPAAGFSVPKKAGAVAPAPIIEHTPVEMASTPAFWVMYLMFILTATFGLIITAQTNSIAKDFGIGDAKALLLGVTFPAVTYALAINRVVNGITRPFFGWVSDRIGRENTMGIAFAFESLSIFLLWHFGHDPTAFVVFSALVFFGYGEIYSLFPATCGDSYGKKFASANAGLLYTAKGAASLLVPVSVMLAASGDLQTVFMAGVAMNLVAAILALVVLKPLRTRMAAKAAVGA